MGGKFWEVGGDKPTGKEANSVAGKETPAKADRTQQLPPSGMIEKPIAAAPSKKEEVALKPVSEPVKAQPAPAVREKTEEELKADKFQRIAAAQRLNREATDELDAIGAQMSERATKRDGDIEALEEEKKEKIGGLDHWMDSQSINIDSAKADHIADAERKRDADRNAASEHHDEMIGKFESERDAAVKAVEAWCAARLYEADPQNHPSVYLADVIKDERLASALKTEGAEPSPAEFFTPVINKIQEERATRLAKIENDFNEKKKISDDNLALKEKKAEETYAASLKAAEDEAANALRDAAETHATEVADTIKIIDKEKAAVNAEAEKDLVALSKKRTEVQLAFRSKMKTLSAGLSIPKEWLEEKKPAETPKEETAGGGGGPLQVFPATAPSQPAKQAQPKKQNRAKAAFLFVAMAGTAAFASYISPWKIPQRFVDRAADIASYFGGEKRLISTKQMESTAKKLADIKRAKSASAKNVPEPPKKHVMTPQERTQLMERIAAQKTAREAKEADAVLKKELNGFERRIATMKNQKGGFLYLGKGSVSYAREIAVTLETKGGALSAKQKKSVAKLLANKDMSRKRLKALHAHVGVLIAMQVEIGKASDATAAAKSKAKAVHKAAERVKAAVQPIVAATPVPSAAPVTAAAPIQNPVEASATSVNQSAGNPAEEKGPKKETIMTAAPMPGGQNATVKASALATDYSASGGAKPPWMDWAKGIDNPNDYATTSQALPNYVELPGTKSMTAAPTAGAVSATLASANVEGQAAAQSPAKKEDVTKPPEKLVDMSEHVKKEIARIDRKNAAKAAKGKKAETAPVPQVVDSSNMKKTTINCGIGKNAWTTEVGYHEGFSPKDNDPDLCDEEGRPKTIQEMAAQLGVMKFPIRGTDSEGSK